MPLVINPLINLSQITVILIRIPQPRINLNLLGKNLPTTNPLLIKKTYNKPNHNQTNYETKNNAR